MRYGPHDRNVLDLWKAKPKSGPNKSTPVVIFFHGGAFRTGDKSHVPATLLEMCLDAGISVASANYRLSETAAFPAPMLDGARAIQFVRKNAIELGIDPKRIFAAVRSFYDLDDAALSCRGVTTPMWRADRGNHPFFSPFPS